VDAEDLIRKLAICTSRYFASAAKLNMLIVTMVIRALPIIGIDRSST